MLSARQPKAKLPFYSLMRDLIGCLSHSLILRIVIIFLRFFIRRLSRRGVGETNRGVEFAKPTRSSTEDKKSTIFRACQKKLKYSFSLLHGRLLRATKGARNPNLNVAFTNACAAVV